jgi:hypothetical protein
MHAFSFILIMIFIFVQGDEEKRQGIQPQSLMDRSLANELPQNQVIIKAGEELIHFLIS